MLCSKFPSNFDVLCSSASPFQLSHSMSFLALTFYVLISLLILIIFVLIPVPSLQICIQRPLPALEILVKCRLDTSQQCDMIAKASNALRKMMLSEKRRSESSCTLPWSDHIFNIVFCPWCHSPTA